MFTVEALTYSAKYVKPEEASVILRLIAGGRPFRLHYFSPYYGVWRDGDFYVGQGSLSVKRLTRGDAMLEGLTFQMTGVDPIKDD